MPSQAHPDASEFHAIACSYVGKLVHLFSVSHDELNAMLDDNSSLRARMFELVRLHRPDLGLVNLMSFDITIRFGRGDSALKPMAIAA